MENVWEKALSLLRAEVNDQIYTAWFLSMQQKPSTSSCLCLSVPNKFFESWIKEKYLGLIKNAVYRVTGKDMEISFEIVPLNPEEPRGAENSLQAPPLFPPEEKNKRASKDKETAVGGWLKSVFTGARQMPESLYQQIGLNPNYTFDHFVVGNSNRFAHAAASAVCDNLAKVYNPLFLYGGVGLGKTHLMQAMGQEILRKNPRARVLYISSEEFTNQLISAIRNKTTTKFRERYRHADVLLLDDIQFIAGKNSTQEEFFHTFNALYDSHKQIVLCSDRSPREIQDLEERLVTRFAWGLTADIQSPDFETRVAILEKKSDTESITVSKSVLFFLAENIKTNIREMEGALIRVVAYSKLTGIPMTDSLAREVLKDMISAEEKKITIDLIQKTVSSFFGIKDSDMQTKKRTRAIAYPRQLAMFLSRELTDHSLPDIGSFFGGRDHTTVLHACDKISREISSSGETKAVIDNLRGKIKK
ncbi:MAG: chromosomal replication initiator protein DnaA [Candidatus Omnitrophota bacterium]